MTSIESGAFYNCIGLKSVTIPNSVTSIGDAAFQNCSGLTSVTIPNSVTSIGEHTFQGCSGLIYVLIPNSVKSIGNCAFGGCSGLTSVSIPNNVTSIEQNAFTGTGWYNSQPDGILYLDNWLIGYKGYKPTGELVIAEGTKGIASYAFSDDRNYNWCSDLTSVIIPNSVTSIGRSAFAYCSGLTSLTIGNSVTSIGISAFYACSSLTSITIPNSVTSIGNFAFHSSGWYNSQPNGILYLDNWLIGYKGEKPSGKLAITEETRGILCYAFQGCSGLTSITIPESVMSIGDYAFQGCSGLTSVTIPNSVKSIGNSAFSYCSGLTSVTIPNSVTSIGGYAFDGCSGLTSVTIGNSVTRLGDDHIGGVFRGCIGLTSVTIPNSVTSIESEAFSGCSGLTSVTFGNSVTSIGGEAFKGCSGLTSITFPNSMTIIGYRSFEGCSSLTSVTIPNSVKSIASGAFGGSNNIINVIVPVIDYGTFCNNNVLRLINTSIGMPVQLIDNEGTEIKEYIIPEGVTSICESSFRGCSGLTSVTIPNSVTSIGNYAFTSCNGLTSVTIPNSVTSIGDAAFQNCSNLTLVTIPTSITSIGNDTFSGCSNLNSVIIPNSVTSIGNSAFYGCRGLTSVTIGSGVTSIGISAFRGCSSLTSVTIPNTVTSIGDAAFVSCSSLTSVKIGGGVINIGESAFSGCGSLETVFAMPKIPPHIEVNTFSNAQNIYLYVPIGKKVTYEAADIWKYFKEINEWQHILKAITPQGIEMQFRVVDEVENTVETYAKGYEVGEDFVPCVDLETEGDLIIPAEIEGYRVVGIGSESFRECMGLTSASLPTGITYIGEGAFRLATNLKAVNIPEGVEEIRAHSFNGCPLTTVILPSTLKRITGTYVFRNSNAKNETCSFIANMKRPSTLDENSIMGMEYYDLYVPKGRKEFYLSEPMWDKFRSIREIGEVDEDMKDIVSAKNMTMKAGEKTTLTVSLTTEATDYNGYQFNLYLPEGISVATDEGGNYLVREKTGREKIALGVSDGSVLFYTTAGKNHAALATGPLMEIELTADSALAAGRYTVRIERVVCATRENNPVSLSSSTATVTVQQAGTGSQGVITADDVEGEPASQIKLPVFLNNTTDINAFYFDLTLPMGVTVAKDKAGQFVASFVGDYGSTMLLSCQPWDPSMGTTNNVNTWRFIATPTSNDVFRANAGRVMNVTLDVDKDMASGVYTARMNVVKLVEAGSAGSRAFNDDSFDSLSRVMHAPASSCTWTSYSSITIRTQQQGDVNGDMTIDVADIATVIDVMAGGVGVDPVSARNADVNGDGTVDVADIAAVIDIMAANARRVLNND